MRTIVDLLLFPLSLYLFPFRHHGFSFHFPRRSSSPFPPSRFTYFSSCTISPFHLYCQLFFQHSLKVDSAVHHIRFPPDLAVILQTGWSFFLWFLFKEGMPSLSDLKRRGPTTGSSSCHPSHTTPPPPFQVPLSSAFLLLLLSFFVHSLRTRRGPTFPWFCCLSPQPPRCVW